MGRPPLPKTGTKVVVRTNAYLWKNRSKFKRVIREAFEKARFTDPSSTVDGVIKASLHGKSDKALRTKNVIAIGPNGEIHGAIFGVPTKVQKPWTDGGLGWFFTSPKLGVRTRVAVADQMMERTHAEMRRAGYTRISTPIGTEEGVRFIQRRHGFTVEEVTPDGVKIWAKQIAPEEKPV
jgi:hypothetical protein